jgi:hypothetical protein
MEPMTIEISAVGETLRLTTKGSKGASTWTRNAAELTKPCVRLRGGPSFRLDVQTRFKLVDDVQAAIAKGGANAQILETAKTDPCSIFRPYEPSPITQAVGVWQKTDKGRWCGTVESTVVASFFRLPIGRTEITQFLCLEGDKLVGPDGGRPANPTIANKMAGIPAVIEPEVELASAEYRPSTTGVAEGTWVISLRLKTKALLSAVQVVGDKPVKVVIDKGVIPPCQGDCTPPA